MTTKYAFQGFHSDPDGEKLKEQREAKIKAGIHKASIQAELKKVIRGLSACCKTTPKQPFRWPKEEDIDRLHKLVDTAYSLLFGKRQAHTPWNKYTAIEQEWPNLKLCKCIESLVDRVIKDVPVRPLIQFVQLAKGQDRELAFKFSHECAKLRESTSKSQRVQWASFRELMLQFREDGKHSNVPVLKTRVKSMVGNLEFTAYAVALEICIEDMAWCRKHYEGLSAFSQWVVDDLEHEKLDQKLTQKFEPVLAPGQERFSVSERRARLKRQRETARKRAQRLTAKEKVPPKRGTSKPGTSL